MGVRVAGADPVYRLRRHAPGVGDAYQFCAVLLHGQMEAGLDRKVQPNGQQMRKIVLRTRGDGGVRREFKIVYEQRVTEA
jgi:hypothetical protein